MHSSIPWLVIANSTHKRCLFFLEALKKLLPKAPVTVVDWTDFLSGKISLEKIPDHPLFVRVETTAQHFPTEKEILRLGVETGDIDESGIKVLPYRRGELLFPRQWFAGFTRLCSTLKSIQDQKKQWQWMNPPEDILMFFDKRQTHAFWSKNQIPVPPALQVQNGEELLETMKRQQLKQVFVKLAYGSSASGIISLYQGRQHFYGLTTLFAKKGRYFNSRRLQKITDNSLKTALEYLFKQGVHIEAGIPKATLSGIPYDLRLLLIGGEIAHRVVRQSHAPMTNLHLGGKRTDFSQLEPFLVPEQWERIFQDCCRISRLHQSFYVGLDVLFHRKTSHPYFLEGNVFGDLLPGLLYEGQSSYHREILRWIHQDDRIHLKLNGRS